MICPVQTDRACPPSGRSGNPRRPSVDMPEVVAITSCSVLPEKKNSWIGSGASFGLGDQPIQGHADVENDLAHDHLLAHHRDVVP